MKLDDIPFVIEDINQEMPMITPNYCKIPQSFSMVFPKDFKKYTEKVNDKFLNRHLSVIEEIAHRYPNNNLPKWMKNYQNRNFKSSLAHDGFFKHATNINSRIKNLANSPLVGEFITYGKLLGTLVQLGDTSSNSSFSTGNGYYFRYGTSLTIGSFYNQIAVDGTSSTGNWKLGAYSDNGSPHTVYAQTGSFANVNNAFTWQSLTEFSLTTAKVWLAFMVDNNATNMHYHSGLLNADLGDTNTQAFAGGFPNDPTGLSGATAEPNSKLGHS